MREERSAKERKNKTYLKLQYAVLTISSWTPPYPKSRTSDSNIYPVGPPQRNKNALAKIANPTFQTQE